MFWVIVCELFGNKAWKDQRAGRRAEESICFNLLQLVARVFAPKRTLLHLLTPGGPNPTQPNPTQAGQAGQDIERGPVGKPPLKRQASGRLLPHTGHSLPRAQAVRAGESVRARSRGRGRGGPGRTNLLGGPEGTGP